MSAPKPANPLGVCYVLVNSFDTANVDKYLMEDGTPMFGVAIIFAANINWDATTQKAVLGYNSRTQWILDNKDTQIVPLQNSGIKVMMTVLGNHSPAGISNFADKASAAAFADQCADAVETYGLDGIDFDDEWVNYGGETGNGVAIPNVNDYSFPYLIQALRSNTKMKDKLISLYFYGPASGTLQYKDIEVGKLINYSWNPYYGGSWAPPSIPGLSKSGIAGAGIALDPVGNTPPQTPLASAEAVATDTLNDGYGLMMYYGLPDTDVSNYLSGISEVLYNQPVNYSG